MSFESDIQLRRRLKKRNTPIRPKTNLEIAYEAKKKLGRIEAIDHLKEAQSKFKDKPTVQQRLPDP